MTCIVGYVTKNAVWLGGDSAGVSNLDLVIRADRKVFTRPAPKRGGRPWGFGFTSSFRMGQLLRYGLELPDDRDVPDSQLEQFMVTTFVDAVRNALKAGGFARKEYEEESAGTFLVAHRGRLFQLESDYQVGEGVARYAAVGCGEPYALGALHALPTTIAPARAIKTALSAAETWSGGVAQPFHIVKIPN